MNKAISTSHIKLDRQRWTHMALCVKNVERSIEWFEDFTHLKAFKRFEDASGFGAWMVDPDEPDAPFMLVLAQFLEGKDPFSPAEHSAIGPFAHFGIELMSRDAVDAIAAKGKANGCLALGPQQMPDPIGYICFLKDPDGNTIEFSYNQGVYEAVRTEWHTLNQST